jgi:hypothetical protein
MAAVLSASDPADERQLGSPSPPDQARDVLAHFHIFKNAGVSIDASLRESFGRAWESFDPAVDWTNVTTARVLRFLERRPALRAFSSHQLRWPSPDTPGVRIHPIVFVRHPIDRVASIYSYSRHLGDAEASARTFPEYVDWITRPAGQIVASSFQTLFLSDDEELVSRPELGPPTRATAAHLEQAMRRIDSLSAFGLVERFDDSVAWLAATLAPTFPELRLRSRHENAQRPAAPLAQRLEEIAIALGPALHKRLVRCNEADLELYRYTVQRFAERAF